MYQCVSVCEFVIVCVFSALSEHACARVCVSSEDVHVEKTGVCFQ